MPRFNAVDGVLLFYCYAGILTKEPREAAELFSRVISQIESSGSRLRNKATELQDQPVKYAHTSTYGHK